MQKQEQRSREPERLVLGNLSGICPASPNQKVAGLAQVQANFPSVLFPSMPFYEGCGLVERYDFENAESNDAAVPPRFIQFAFAAL